VLDEEVEADGLLVGLRELVVGEARRDGRLAHGAVAEEDDLELALVDLLLVAHGPTGGGWSGAAARRCADRSPTRRGDTGRATRRLGTRAWGSVEAAPVVP
jgi:hypothetical protein